MNEKVLRFRVGVLVMIAILILIILIVLNSDGWGRNYTAYIKPQSAPGVTVGTPIRKNGILIGRVSSVRTEDDHVVLGLSINEKEKVYTNEVISIGAESFLGDAGLEVLPLPKEERGNMISQNDVMTRVSVKRNPMEIVDVALNLEDDISQTLEAIRTASLAINEGGDGIRELTANVNAALTSDESDLKSLIGDVRNMSMKAEAALDNFNRIFENVNEIVADPILKRKVTEFVNTLPEIFKEVQNTVVDTRETINSFREVSGKASDSLDNVNVFTESLKDNGPEILEQVNGALANVQGLSDKINDFTESLGKISETFANPDGTVGKLFNETELYDSVLETANNVKALSMKLEPIANDLRNFSDQLARNPGTIVRGAFKKEAGYKGTPGGNGRFFK
jgi:phospholipid/cholesterol/gamma-HCH transport system substrate-binding protein